MNTFFFIYVFFKEGSVWQRMKQVKKMGGMIDHIFLFICQEMW